MKLAVFFVSFFTASVSSFAAGPASFEESLSGIRPAVSFEAAEGVVPSRVSDFSLREEGEPNPEDQLSMTCYYAVEPKFGGVEAAESCKGTNMTCFYAVSNKFPLNIAARRCRGTNMPCYYAVSSTFPWDVAAQSCRGTNMACYNTVSNQFPKDVAARSCRETNMTCFYALSQRYPADVAAKSCRGTNMPCFYSLSNNIPWDQAAISCGKTDGKSFNRNREGKIDVSNFPDYAWESIPCSQKNQKRYPVEVEWQIMKKDKNDYYVCDVNITYEQGWANCSESNPHTNPGMCTCAGYQTPIKRELTNKCHWEAQWW